MRVRGQESGGGVMTHSWRVVGVPLAASEGGAAGSIWKERNNVGVFEVDATAE